MRRKIYKLLRWYLRPEIEQDYDLDMWISGKLMLNTEKATSYAQGYTDAKEELELKYQKRLSDVEDQTNTYRQELNEAAERKATTLYAEKNWLVNPLHVFQVVNGIPFLDLEPITKHTAQELKSEAHVLMGLKLWKIFQETIRQKAIGQGLNPSQKEKEENKFSPNPEQVMAARMMLNNLDVQKSIVEYLDTLAVDNLVDGINKKGVV